MGQYMNFIVSKHVKRFRLLALASLGITCTQANAQWQSDCEERLNDYSRASSASLIIENERALMVWVSYGDVPGWDFPGGTLHSDEYACETAEREACEETGFHVRTTGKITTNVFTAERTGGPTCAIVDEGRLDQRWVSLEEIESLQFRGGTWGDKKAILKQHLSSEVDACGCTGGEGWSSTNNECRLSSETDVNEAQFCIERDQQSQPDACGCTGGEGWSSTNNECSLSSETDANEALLCATPVVKDSDSDGIVDVDDNCPSIANPEQWDKDGDAIGNDCDLDIDGDGVSNDDELAVGTKPWDSSSFPGQTLADDRDQDGLANDSDNCPEHANQGQWDKDNDGLGNECDPDIDGDGVSNEDEIAAGTMPWNNESFPGQSLVDDRDQDGLANEADNCPDIANQGQWDKDKDGKGNECDSDLDGDGVSNTDELLAGTKVWDSKSFPRPATAEDRDGDGINNEQDNCADIANGGQWDKDNDGLGNECDPDIDGDGFSNDAEIAADTLPWDNLSFPEVKTDIDSDNDGLLDSVDACPHSQDLSQIGDNGCADLIIQAEDYIRFHDNSSGNEGGAYKNDDVDIEESSDTAGGYNIGWTEAGEWLEYDIELAGGQYQVSSRVASDVNGTVINLSIDGENISNSYLSSSGGWQAFVDKNIAKVELSSGKHTLRYSIVEGPININWLKLASITYDPNEVKPGSDTAALCVFDYDLTLSSNKCSTTQNSASHFCRTSSAATYGWFEQCLGINAQAAIARCVENGAYIGIASHAPLHSDYNDKVAPIVNQHQFPALLDSEHYANESSAINYPVIDDKANWNCDDCAYHMVPGSDKAEVIKKIMRHYGLNPELQDERERVIFWDDSTSNLSDVSRLSGVSNIHIPRNQSSGESGGCGIDIPHIEAGWNAFSQKQ